MNQQSFLLVPLALLGLFFSSCSKKVDPDSTLNRNGTEGSSVLSDPSRDFNAGDDLSPAGSALDGNLFASDDLLSPVIQVWMHSVIRSMSFAHLIPFILASINIT
jgi:hypothetical protein